MLLSREKKNRMRPRGFTVLEILLVLALFGIAAGMFVYNLDSFKETFFENRTPENVLITAVKHARFYASNRHEVCTLVFEPENRCFKVQTLMGQECETFNLSPNRERTEITFFDAKEKESREFDWVPNYECKRLRFDPNGLFSHVFVKIYDNNDTKNYRLDTFSGKLCSANL